MGQTITEAGDTCRELLLLIEGDAKIHYQTGGLARIEQVRPGQTLDELEVLAHSNSENTIVADSETTRILAIPSMPLTTYSTKTQILPAGFWN
jgi:CRP-like cAMP-binding protein